MLIRGHCHCENIAFVLTWEPDPLEIPARACTCSFCTKHGGVWTSTPAGSLLVTVQSAARVSHYEFGTRTAQFHVCSNCGVVPLVTSSIEGHLYAVVNVNTFEAIDSRLVRQFSATFDGEEATLRLQRRQQRWIANVVLQDGGR